jgi:hypothetical protein
VPESDVVEDLSRVREGDRSRNGGTGGSATLGGCRRGVLGTGVVAPSVLVLEGGELAAAMLGKATLAGLFGREEGESSEAGRIVVVSERPSGMEMEIEPDAERVSSLGFLEVVKRRTKLGLLATLGSEDLEAGCAVAAAVFTESVEPRASRCSES